MPHSVRLHNLLLENGYKVSFWYYKDLTSLYPWSYINAENEYYVFGERGNNILKLLSQAHQSDLVIITGWHTIVHVLLALFCYLNRIKYAYWIDVPEKPKKGLRWILKNTLLRMADFLFVTGREGINRYISWTKIPYSRFRDFPYLSAIVHDEEIETANKYRISSLGKGAKIRVLIANRFEKRKGYKCVYEALKRLNNTELNKYNFTIIGSGTEYEFYKNQFTSIDLDIVFKFWVDYDDYLNYVKTTDILIHASLHEPFGIPPIDAMSFGKLVIASDEVMSTKDRILNGFNGYLFKAGDFEELFKILKLLYDKPELIYKLGRNAFHDSKLYEPFYNLNVINEILGV